MIQLQRNDVFGTWEGQDGSTRCLSQSRQDTDTALDLLENAVLARIEA